MTLRQRIAFLILASWLCASSVRAQLPGAASTIDAAYFAGHPMQSLAESDAELARDSSNVDVLWRAARAALALGILADRQDADSPMYVRAESYARMAVRVSPGRVEGHYWLAAALGRRALHADLKTTVSLANATVESANRALAIDSLHAGAHDVIGKLNSEVCKLPRAVRFLASRLLRLSVARATSWELAERHLARAVALDSTMVVYRFDLAEMYVRTERKAQAARLLREVLAMQRVHPVDEKFQRDALTLLNAL